MSEHYQGNLQPLNTFPYKYGPSGGNKQHETYLPEVGYIVMIFPQVFGPHLNLKIPSKNKK